MIDHDLMAKLHSQFDDEISSIRASLVKVFFVDFLNAFLSFCGKTTIGYTGDEGKRTSSFPLKHG